MSGFQKKIDAIPIKLNHREIILTDDRILQEGDEILLDFGQHLVAYLRMDIRSHNHHQDAPLYFQINFYEHYSEIGQNADSYHGWLPKSWIQEEKIHVDVLPTTLHLERRYAFRYVKITVLNVSNNFSVSFPKIIADAVSSAADESLQKTYFTGIDEEIDRVCCTTLHECMQEVFEDGPKRDRRMWLGDLRLEALTNYKTYAQNDLVKKCLYMFAETAFEDGTVPANLFIHPILEGDYQFLSDYSLLYITTLKEYYDHTGDFETLSELYPVAFAQYRKFSQCIATGIPEGDLLSNAFIDWNLNLCKEAAITGVYLYSLEHLIALTKVLSLPAQNMENELNQIRSFARKTYYLPESNQCISNGQLSYASVIWLVLGGVLMGEDAVLSLKELEKAENMQKIVSPYLYHYYIEALIKAGLFDEAIGKLRYYWGKMLEDGADTFYEIFNPENNEESPYGGKIVHSFCHAWSCTPSYFLRTYFDKK